MEAVYVTMDDGAGNTLDFGEYGVGRKLENGAKQYIENVEVTWETIGSNELFVVTILSGDTTPVKLRSASQGTLMTPQIGTPQYIVPTARPTLALQLPSLPPTPSESTSPVGMRLGLNQGAKDTSAEMEVSRWQLFSNPSAGYLVYVIGSVYSAPVAGSAVLAQWQGSPEPGSAPGLAGEYVGIQAPSTPFVQGWRPIAYKTFDGGNSPTLEGYQIVNVGGMIVPVAGAPYANEPTGSGNVLVSPSGNGGEQCLFLPPDTATGSQSQFWSLVPAQ